MLAAIDFQIVEQGIAPISSTSVALGRGNALQIFDEKALEPARIAFQAALSSEPLASFMLVHQASTYYCIRMPR